MSTATLPPRPFWALAVVHARFQFLETIRIPIAVIGNLLFPSLALLFFVIPQRAVADDPGIATAAIAQLGVFAVMSTCLFSFGVGVSEDRALPFDPFLRTLPAGAGPRLAGRVLNGVLWSYLALVPLVLLGVVAMIRLHIRGFARSLRRTPLVEAAYDLRLLLFYTGTVWGGGAFLIMPGLPAPALVFLFAVTPSLGLALTLRDAKGFAAFAAPAALLTAGASLVGAWPLELWVAGTILTGTTALGLVFL